MHCLSSLKIVANLWCHPGTLVEPPFITFLLGGQPYSINFEQSLTKKIGYDYDCDEDLDVICSQAETSFSAVS